MSYWFNTEIIYLTAGKGEGISSKNSFDRALQDAGIANFNLVKVTSILPPGTAVSSMPDDIGHLDGRGLLLPTVYGCESSKEKGKEIYAGISTGVPAHSDKTGVIFEHTCENAQDATEAKMREMVNEGMESRGHSDYQIFTISASSRVKDKWCSVISAAIFCDEKRREVIESKA